MLANSMFTAHWIKQVWKKEAEVVYPPVSLQVPEAEKRNVIVSIGRFIDSHNSKNHKQQLNAFRETVGQGRVLSWRLTLIGFCTLVPERGCLP